MAFTVPRYSSEMMLFILVPTLVRSILSDWVSRAVSTSRASMSARPLTSQGRRQTYTRTPFMTATHFDGRASSRLHTNLMKHFV